MSEIKFSKNFKDLSVKTGYNAGFQFEKILSGMREQNVDRMISVLDGAPIGYGTDHECL